MSKGLSERQRQIYEFIDNRSREGLVTTTLDIIANLFPQRMGNESFRKSVWRSLVSLERRGKIKLYSRRPRKRERGAGGTIRYVTTNFQEATNERRRP